jgi:hypothetical protein
MHAECVESDMEYRDMGFTNKAQIQNISAVLDLVLILTLHHQSSSLTHINNYSTRRKPRVLSTGISAFYVHMQNATSQPFMIHMALSVLNYFHGRGITPSSAFRFALLRRGSRSRPC